MSRLKHFIRTSVAILASLMVIGSLSADDKDLQNWPHWRGVDGNGVSAGKPPLTWSSEKNVKWKVPIEGKGSGSPIIWKDRVFVVTAEPVGGAAAPAQPQPRQRRGRGRGVAPSEMHFKVMCFDRENGKRIWEQTATTQKPNAAVHPDNNFASASPCTDGNYLYAHFGSRGLYCYDLDGKLIWKRTDFPAMTTRGSFGEGSSPTLVDDMIIVPHDHEGESFLYAFNKKNGEDIWKVARDEPTNWATPLIVEHEGKKQVIMNGQNYVRSYDLTSGKELWRCGGQTQRPCASPVVFEDMVVVTSGHRGSFMGAFKLDGSGDIGGTDSVAWSLQSNTPDIASPVLSGNRLYYIKGKGGVLSCQDVKTGKEIFGATRLPSLKTMYASLFAANGHIFLTDREGTTLVIKDADKFEVVETNRLGETVDATPAAVDNQLFIRGEKHLFCIQE